MLQLRARWRSVVVLAGLVALSGSPAWSATLPTDFRFIKVADTSTPIPSMVGNFSGFNGSLSSGDVCAPSLEAGRVAFVAKGRPVAPDPLEQIGQFLYESGTLRCVAGPVTPTVNGPVRILQMGPPSLTGREIAFRATGSAEGVWRSTNGVFKQIASSSQFYLVSNPGAAGPYTSFIGDLGTYSSYVEGIYRHDGTNLVPITTAGQGLPGGLGSIQWFNYLVTPGKDGDLAFFAKQSNGEGIYAQRDGQMQRVADTTMSLPEHGSRFVRLEGPVFDGRDVAFIGRAEDQVVGVYAEIQGELRCIADSTMVLPGLPPDMRLRLEPGAAYASVDDGAVAFSCGTSYGGGSQLFTDFSGSLQRVIGNGDVLSGKTVWAVEIGREALDDGQIAFHVAFTDQSQGIYIAVVPEPGSMILLIGVLGCLLRRRRPAA